MIFLAANVALYLVELPGLLIVNRTLDLIQIDGERHIVWLIRIRAYKRSCSGHRRLETNGQRDQREGQAT